MNKNKIKEKMFDAKQMLKDILGLRNTFGDKIEIKDEILIYQGKDLVFKSKGHIVNIGLAELINFISCNTSGTTLSPSYTWGTDGYIRVGTGAGTTTNATTALTIPSSTAPSTQSGVTANPSAGAYRVSWIATWVTGAIAALVVTEMGLFLWLNSTLIAFGGSLTTHTTQLFSRLSEADGDFTHFTINTAVPLTIEWRLTFSFA